MTTACPTAQLQHAASEALLNVGSMVGELLPTAGEPLLNMGSMIAEI